MPFKSESILGLYKEICEAPLEFPDDVFVGDSLKHLLTGLLQKDPEQRISLFQAMTHPWVTYNGELSLLGPATVSPSSRILYCIPGKLLLLSIFPQEMTK